MDQQITAHGRVKERWYSERLGRHVDLVRWGHHGQPILLFPTAGGDAEEMERWLMIRALEPLLAQGRIKIYSCDSIGGRVLLEREGGPQHQMWIQDQFHRYIRNEVIPAIRMDCKSPDIEVWTAGASIGAFNAVAVLCRFPDVFSRAIGMSGTYDIRRFYDARPHEFSNHFWVSSPLHFVPTLSGPHLDKLKERFVMLPSGEGRAEDISESWRLANVLGAKGIPNLVDSWGPQWHHDWPTWRHMLPQILDKWTQ